MWVLGMCFQKPEPRSELCRQPAKLLLNVSILLFSKQHFILSPFPLSLLSPFFLIYFLLWHEIEEALFTSSVHIATAEGGERKG